MATRILNYHISVTVTVYGVASHKAPKALRPYLINFAFPI